MRRIGKAQKWPRRAADRQDPAKAAHVALLLALLLMIPLAGLTGFLLGQRQQTQAAALPVLRAAPAYRMTNQWGETVSSANFRGKLRVVSFLFPYCTTMCPLIAAHLANLENLGLRPAGLEDDVQLVSFNLDPAATGPKQMRAFLRQYGWDPKNRHWQYLTGTESEIRLVVTQGFGVGFQRVGLAAEQGGAGSDLPVAQPEVVNPLAQEARPNYDIVHDDVLELVDGNGRIRKIWEDADSVDWRQLMATIEDLLHRPG